MSMAKYALILIVLAAAVTIIILLIVRKHHDTLCLCREMDRKECVNGQLRRHLYETGQLTEFTPQKYIYYNPMAPMTQFHVYEHSTQPNC